MAALERAMQSIKLDAPTSPDITASVSEQSSGRFVTPIKPCNRHDVMYSGYSSWLDVHVDWQPEPEKIDIFRSIAPTKAKEELNSQFQNSPLATEPRNNAVSDNQATYIIGELPQAGPIHENSYDIGSEVSPPLAEEETRKNVRAITNESDVDSIISQYTNAQVPPAAANNYLTANMQDRTTQRVKTLLRISGQKKSLPRHACLVHSKEQYRLDKNLLKQPQASMYLVKERTEISPGRFMAKLILRNSSEENRLDNQDAHQNEENDQHGDTKYDQENITSSGERKHFPLNLDRTGYVIFSSNLASFSGSIRYPLPNKKAMESRIGYGGNAIVFIVFHAGKEFAVKKTVYRNNEITIHSQLCHPNIINLEAALIGENHERHKKKFYVYCFMPKTDINFRNVLTTREHGCLKHIKNELVNNRERWHLVLGNVKYVLKGVLKALEYMHSQGLVHRDIKASNILIKITCECKGDILYCNCRRRKFSVQIGDFDSSTIVPGYQLQLEEHQMIRRATVLPLGTMGYRAPEVSMYLVLSGPFEVLYTTSVDIWSFGCLLLTIFIGKSGPLKQRGEASLLLSAQDHPCSQELYHNIIKVDEITKHFSNTPQVRDLVEKCLQVKPHCRPTAKELLNIDFFADP